MTNYFLRVHIVVELWRTSTFVEMYGRNLPFSLVGLEPSCIRVIFVIISPLSDVMLQILADTCVQVYQQTIATDPFSSICVSRLQGTYVSLIL